MSLLPYSPLGGGVLTGKYNDGALPDGARFSAYFKTGNERQQRMARRFLNERTVETTKRLQVIARDLGISVTALCVAWTKQHDFVASTIIGATTVAQLEESLKAADLVLDAGDAAPHRRDRRGHPESDDGRRAAAVVVVLVLLLKFHRGRQDPTPAPCPSAGA